jgi:hypothetical protein
VLLGFKRRFAPFVEDGSKTHTIRSTRKNQPHVGEICHCYVDPRQKTMRLLGRWPCVKVESIEIRWPKEYEMPGDDPLVFIDGQLLSKDECDALAWRDGFRGRGQAGAFSEMVDYWSKPKHTIPFEGQIIHWNRTRVGRAILDFEENHGNLHDQQARS